jgi:hypothetical protein
LSAINDVNSGITPRQVPMVAIAGDRSYIAPAVATGKWRQNIAGSQFHFFMPWQSPGYSVS